MYLPSLPELGRSEASVEVVVSVGNKSVVPFPWLEREKIGVVSTFAILGVPRL